MNSNIVSSKDKSKNIYPDIQINKPSIQYFNINFKEKIIVNDPVQNVKITLKPKNNKLLVYNSQNYKKYKNQHQRSKRKDVVNHTIENKNESSDEYSNSDFDDARKSKAYATKEQSRASKIRDSYSNYIKNSRINESNNGINENQNTSLVSKIHYNQVIIDANPKQKIQIDNNSLSMLSKKLKNTKIYSTEIYKISNDVESNEKSIKSRNKLAQNQSFKNLKYQNESPYFTKLTNSNSSGNLIKQKHSIVVRKDDHITKAQKQSKFSKERQLIN